MNSLKFTRIFALLIVFCMLTPAAFAHEADDDNSIHLRYNQIDYFTIEFTISPTGSASCYSLVGTKLSSYNIALNMQLQRSSNGRTWSTVHEWSTSGTQTSHLDKTYYVSSGYDYRIHVTTTVTNSSGRVVETATRDSSIVSY